ncbi:DUF2007 domain-containing protein [Anatilimnocola sp. NA78]|uniref:putative signal transducing protein n=1 Tax=Anatilimnocola sp. NA78 TaxID=3415683 RepID=UPI003CE46A9D
MLGRLVTLEVYQNAMQAHLVKNQLEAAGIRCVLADEYATTMVWHLTNAIGGIKLQVAEEDFERAAEALDAVEQQLQHGDEEDAPATATHARDEDADDQAAAEPKPGTDEDDSEPTLNAREQDAERAYRAALFGFMFPPLQFYATWLLLSVWQADDPIRPAVRRKLYWAIGFNVPMFFLAAAATLIWLRSLIYGPEL